MSEDSSNNQNQPGADQLARRDFVSILAAGAGAASAGLATANAAAAQRPWDAPGSLFDKLYGCLAGCFVGSAMGVVTEGWPYEKTISTYGVLKTLEPWPRYGYDWIAGSTEDGVERVKHLCTAIIDKQDRITAEDVLKE